MRDDGSSIEINMKTSGAMPLADLLKSCTLNQNLNLLDQ